MRVGLVLGAGGVIGGSWLMGALEALEAETGWHATDAEQIVGTSAGAVIGALAAAGVPPEYMSAYATGEVLDDVAEAEARAAATAAATAERASAGEYHLQWAFPPIGPGSWRLAMSTLLQPHRYSPAALLAGWLPRGFISTAPFLLAYWVSFTREMRLGAWPRRAYVASLLVPFLINGLLVATQHPAQPYFRGRALLADVARDVETDRKDYDLVLVHHWWMGQYYHYYLSEPQTVWPIGRDREGTAAALDDLTRVPAGARVLLVVNDLATGTDPDGSVVAALKATRPLVRERPCLHSAVPGTGLVCARIYLFGAAPPPSGQP